MNAKAKGDDREVLRLDLGVDGVSLGRLIDAQTEFLGILREVATSVVGDPAAIQWAVDDIQANSLDLFVRPIPLRESVPKAVLAETVQAVAKGISSLERRASRPRHFSNAALRHADALAKLRDRGLTKIHVRTAETETALTPRTVANVAEIVSRTIDAVGSVEGRLEAMNVHGRERVFFVWDPLTGGKVRCEFGQRIPPDEVGAAVTRRVAVTGVIRYDETGAIRELRADRLTILEPPEGLPSADDVAGILAPAQ